MRTCESNDCDSQIIGNKRKRFCSKKCYNREYMRERYRNDPEFRERRKKYQKEYMRKLYWNSLEYRERVRKRVRERYWNDPELSRKRMRERWKNNSEFRERQLKRRRKRYQERYQNDPDYRERELIRNRKRNRERRKDLEYRERRRKYDQERWKNNTEYREREKKRMKKYTKNRRLNDPDYREYQREYHKKRYRRSIGIPEDADLTHETSIERIIREWLEECDIEFKQNFYINLKNPTHTFVDFYIPEIDLCIYCDGDYYHGPKRPDVQERDRLINNNLENMGYNVFRMTGSEVRSGLRPWWMLETIESKW